MTTDQLKQHALDFLKGLLAVMAVQAGLAALQYIGAHIPDAVTYLGQIAAAYGTIHITHA